MEMRSGFPAAGREAPSGSTAVQLGGHKPREAAGINLREDRHQTPKPLCRLQGFAVHAATPGSLRASLSGAAVRGRRAAGPVTGRPLPPPPSPRRVCGHVPAAAARPPHVSRPAPT